MNKYVLALTATALTASVVAPVANANELAFKDLSGYAKDTKDAVQLLVDKKIVNGTTATTFSPNTEITRGQVVKILGRYLQNVEGQKVPADWNTKARFSDVPLTHSDKELVQLAALTYDAGIFTGSEGKLMTSGTMSRENLALVMNRLAKQMTGEQDLVALAAGKEANVTDLAKAKEESHSAIEALNALNISNVEQFNPKGTVKRVHFASLFAKLLLTVEDLEQPAPPVVDEAVTVFEQTVAAVNVETADEATLKAVVTAYNALSAEQKTKLSAATIEKVQAVEKKLETPPTTGGGGGSTTPTEDKLLTDKINNIGALVNNADVAVSGNGKTVQATVVNDAASVNSFLGLYGSLVTELGIKKVNGSDATSFTTLGYLMELAGAPDNLGELKGQTFTIPVTVNNGGVDYNTTITIQVN